MQVVIEYVLDGDAKGYTITSPTRGLSDEAIKAIWRNAMPRGQGWSSYIGAASLKAFALPDESIAFAQTTITDMEDESGRKGIRRAVVDVYSPSAYLVHLQRLWTSYSPSITADVRISYRAIRRKLPAPKKDKSVLLSYPYLSAPRWQKVEALLLALALDPPRGYASPLAFTSLALEPRGENPLIALPSERVESLSGVPVVDLSAWL